MTRLALVLLIASACSSSEARDTTTTEPTAVAKPVEAAPKAEPAPAPAAAPAAPAAAAPAAPAAAKLEPLPLTAGNSFTKVGLRTMEKVSNAIDAAGTDCLVLARNLTALTKDIKKAVNTLGENGQQFRTLNMSRALRDRQKAQRALLKSCKASEPLAKTAINASVGAMQSYDQGYDGEHSVWQ